ncbi:MAG: ABC transporter permease [Verrucomicrobiales bacterium]|nr:ABC transporter permease [Verrucomicrobiales bacterium]
MITSLTITLRRWMMNPGHAAIAIVTLALGIGLNTSMFTALQFLLMRQLPYPNPNRLVQLFRSSPGSNLGAHITPADYIDLLSPDSGLESVAAINNRQINLSDPGRPAERVNGLQVTASFFTALGVEPQLGRTFTPEEDQPGKNQVVVIDHGMWQGRFGGDPNIIGRVLRLDGEPVTVIGVMPAQFHDVLLAGPTLLWRPIALTDAQKQDRDVQYLKCIGRLRPGISLEQAKAGLDLVASRSALERGDSSGVRYRPKLLAESSLPVEARRIVWSVMMLAAFVLLIACVNLANLEFARSAARSREIAIRATLGAPRSRLVAQILSDSLVLALLGGALGLLLAWIGNQVLSRQFVFDQTRVLNLDLNWRVFTFSLGAASLAGLAFGLVPAFLAARADTMDVLKQNARGGTTGHRQRRLQSVLIVLQLALALVLLSGAGLMVDGLKRFREINPGWAVDEITLGYLTLPDARYGSDESRRQFTTQVLDRLTAIPGVQSVALGWTLPIRQFNATSSFDLGSGSAPAHSGSPVRHINPVTPGYFQTLGMRMLAGRDFSSTDTADHPPVVIINQSMARAFWPDQSPLGQRLGNEEIIGVVSDVRFPANPAERRTPYQTYRPFDQMPSGNLVVAVRGHLSPDTLRHAVAAVDPDQPVGSPGPATQVIGESLDKWAIAGRLLIAFAVLGVFLASLGVFGVVSGAVVRRRAEIGIRMALGARIPDVTWLVLRLGLRLAIFGSVIGLIGAAGLTRLLAAVLAGLPPGNPWILAGVNIVLLLITVAACAWPALRAARVDPAIALRSE